MNKRQAPYTVDFSVSPPSCLPTGLDCSNFVDITQVGDSWRRYLDPQTSKTYDGAVYAAYAGESQDE